MKTPNKYLFVLIRDGIVLPDTHVFRFSKVSTAILTLNLFSVTFASRDIVLKCVGEIDEYGNIVSNNNYVVCDFWNSIDYFINLSESDKENCGFVVDDLYTIRADVDKMIQLQFKDKEAIENEQADTERECI